jgi:tetratricopeptide (TPR) repeat protein
MNGESRNMKKANPESSTPRGDFNRPRGVRLIIAGGVLVVLFAIFLRREQGKSAVDRAAATAPLPVAVANSADMNSRSDHVRRSTMTPAPAASAEEIVSGKVLQFGRSRREIVRDIARRSGKDVLPAVEQFFDAIEAGDWAEIDARWKALAKHSGQYENPAEPWPELNPFWPAVLDAYGVAEQAHLWPAQKLLDYGNAILDSLRPGMVYVGGTDPGRWIPELLNETSGGEQHIIVTQNAFADSRYLEFMQTLYGDRFAALTREDSERAFAEYMADVQERLKHDQDFPDEPKQMRPGESSRIVDGRLQVSGQVSVMAINEKLLQMMMEKNPGLSFAIEQSFPMKSTYENATPVGPIMELGVRDEQNALTRERAAQSVDYWRATAEQLLSDAQAADSHAVRMSYSKLASNQGALLLDRHFTAEAEQMFRYAVDIAPSSPEAVHSYVNLLVEQNRVEDAIKVAETAVKLSAEPERWAAANDLGGEYKSQQFRDLLNQLQARQKK